jgi:hypothetical protein
MNRVAIAGAVLVGSAALVALGYWAGQRSENEEASRYLFDVASHMALSCANEHIVALTDFREGRTDEAIRGLELLVAAKLANLEFKRISDTTIAKKSVNDLKVPLNAYQAKFKSPILDPKTNPRLSNLVGAGQ